MHVLVLRNAYILYSPCDQGINVRSFLAFLVTLC